MRVWRIEDFDTDPAMPRFGAEELLCLEVAFLLSAH